MIELRQLAAFILATQAQSDVRGFGYTRDVFITDLDVHDPCAPMLLHGYIYIYISHVGFAVTALTGPLVFSRLRVILISHRHAIYICIYTLGSDTSRFFDHLEHFNESPDDLIKIVLMFYFPSGKEKSRLQLYFRTQLRRKNIVNRLK